MIGETILHYKIIKELGRGGMGVVYLAEDTKLKRQVAIKFLPKQISAGSDERKRFEIEAQAAAALNHSNITIIHAIEKEGDNVFIVMEFIDGIELKDKVKSGTISTKELLNIAIQIAEGLEAAHKKGIVHRDIKSQNIMITNEGKVKIMDFGLAKVKGGSQLTQIGSTIGTVAYMSPEQTRGDEVDHRTDIWSLGVVVYEMLTGKMPFKGDYDQAIIYSILNEELDPVTEYDEGLTHIIGKSLAKNPDERYQTAREIAEELITISQGGEVKRAQIKQSKLPLIVAGAAVILIAITFYLFIPLSKGGGKTTVGVKTIAVLPFDDLSPKKDQGYFSDGLTEEFINVLSRNPNLRVTAKTSSFSFRGKGLDIKTIAAKLNVKNILEGSVQKAGNNLRISADLVNVKTDATLWSKTYDGTLNNIFALQDSISGNVAEALNAALFGKEGAAPEQNTNPEAYNNYLLGNHFSDLYGKENSEKAESYYQKALSIDSSYAPAWVGLSELHSDMANNGYVPVDEANTLALKESEKAIELDPKLAEAYSQMAWIEKNYHWNWKAADEALKKGLELEPGNSDVINGAALLAHTLGHFDKAIKLERRSIEIDPVDIDGYLNLGLSTWYKGLPDVAIGAFRKCLELSPQFPDAHVLIGLVYLEKGMPDSAMTEIEKEQDPFWKIQGLAIVDYTLGRKKEADAELADLIKNYVNRGAYEIAEIYAYRGEKDSAFKWLEKSYNLRDSGLSEMVGDPLMRNIVKDSRYAAFMKKMNLPL